MSIYAPPNPIDYQPPPPRPSYFRSGTLIAWLVIALCVTVTLTREQWAPRLRTVSRPASRPVARDVADVNSTQLMMVSRASVGAKALLPTGQQPARGEFVKNVEQAVTNRVDELRAVPVVGELEGAKAALERLDNFELKYLRGWSEGIPPDLRHDAFVLRQLYDGRADRVSDDDSNGLLVRHGWFGRLATAYGKGDDDPGRAGVLGQARTTFLAIAALVLGAIGALLLGIVLAVIAIVLFANGRIRPRYRPAALLARANSSPDRSGPFVEAFAVYLASFIGLSLLLALLFPGAVFWPNWAMTAVVPLAVVWLRFRGVSFGEIRRGLGWHLGGRGVGGLFREIGSGIVGYVAGLPVVAFGLVVTVVLVVLSHAKPGHPVQDMPMGTAAERLQLFILVAVWAPVVEETMFRGALFHHLRGRAGWWVSTLVVSLVFAIIHPQGLTAVPVLAAVAFVLAGIREWRDSIVASMTAHALHNGAVITLLLVATS